MFYTFFFSSWGGVHAPAPDLGGTFEGVHAPALGLGGVHLTSDTW